MYEPEIDLAIENDVLLELRYDDEWRVVCPLARKLSADRRVYVVAEQVSGADDNPCRPLFRSFYIDRIQALQVLRTRHVPGTPGEEELATAYALMTRVHATV